MGNVLSTSADSEQASHLTESQRRRRSTWKGFVRSLSWKLLAEEKQQDQRDAGSGETDIEEDMDLRLTNRGVLLVGAISATSCAVLRLVLRDLLRKQAWYKPNHPGMFELCALGMIHAGVLAYYGIKKCFFPRTSWMDPRGCKRLISASLGYFMHDFLALRSMWADDPTMVVHHLAGLALLGSALHKPEVYPMVGPYAVIELSTIFLNGIAMLREVRMEDTPLNHACLGLFVVTFFVTRVVWMPYVTARFYDHERMKALGRARPGLLVLTVLNIYWFKAIIAKVQRALAKRAPAVAAMSAVSAVQ